MNSLISICIPTYQRPDLLQQAIESCLSQTYPDIEIIVSDDSQNTDSETLCQQFKDAGHPIRYIRNTPSLHQVSNVNQLFDLAMGDRLVLLHDDDLLMPDAIEKMAECWQQHPEIIACFGKQYIIDMQSQVLTAETHQLNRDYHRTENQVGLQPALRSAIIAQFPNNGYMILTGAARDIRYDQAGGDACDFEFSLRLAQRYSPFFFIDHYTAMYRLTTSSVASSSENTMVVAAYQALEKLPVPPELQMLKHQRLQQLSVFSVQQWLKLGNRQAARAIYTSAYYAWQNRLLPKGILQGLLIISPDGLRQTVIRLKQALS